MKKSTILLLCLTPLFIWVAQLTAFFHEYAHATTAWIFGFKSNPFDIIYGGWNWPNMLFLANIDENVNYDLINQMGHGKFISLIAFAGPGIATLSIYLITLYLLKKSFNQYLYYLVLWINLANIRELWAYVPLRALSTHADIANINHSLNISPWWIFIFVTPFVLWGVCHFFVNTLKQAYQKLGFYTYHSQVALLIWAVLFFFSMTYLQIFMADYNFITKMLTGLSMILAPVILYYCWPSKRMVAGSQSLKR